jgi:hypothetical protein
MANLEGAVQIEESSSDLEKQLPREIEAEVERAGESEAEGQIE